MKIGIYVLASGIYQVSFSGLDGKRKRRKFKTLKEASDFTQKLKTHKIQALPVSTDRNISKVLTEYIEKTPETLLKTRGPGVFESFVQYFGRLSCGDLNKALCQHWLETLKKEKDYSSRTLRVCKYTYSSSFFKYLLEEGLIPKNYMAEVRIKLGTRKINRQFFSEPQLKNILGGFKKFSEKECHPPIYLMTHTGCKGREALRLKWVDVNLKAGSVFFPATSNANGRVVHLSSYILAFLKQLPRVGEYVFLDEEQKPWTVNKFYKRMASARTAMDLGSDWDSFTFRHTFAYHFLRQGRTLQQLQVVLGHRQIQQTIDFYGDIVSRKDQKSSPY